MKSIMYHYVREHNANMPFFRYLHIDDFRQQLDYLDETYGFVGRDEFLASFENGDSMKDSVVLTFDDGLSDHYQYVLPELEKRNLWGIFYIPTEPFLNGRELSVHLIHCLLGTYGGKYMLNAAQKIIVPEMLSHSHIEEFRQLTYPDQEDDLESTTLFKRLLNYYISYEWQRPVLEQLVRENPCDTKNLYLTPQQINEMQNKGMLIGSHSVSHPVFSKLSIEQQKNEIKDSFSFLENVSNSLDVRTFCYPYGGFHSFTKDTENLLAKSGCLFSFNVEPRDIEFQDLKERPQALPRYDCNLFPYGKAR